MKIDVAYTELVMLHSLWERRGLKFYETIAVLTTFTSTLAVTNGISLSGLKDIVDKLLTRGYNKISAISQRTSKTVTEEQSTHHED